MNSCQSFGRTKKSYSLSNLVSLHCLAKLNSGIKLNVGTTVALLLKLFGISLFCKGSLGIVKGKWRGSERNEYIGRLGSRMVNARESLGSPARPVLILCLCRSLCARRRDLQYGNSSLVRNGNYFRQSLPCDTACFSKVVPLTF